jgi:hypothetical protein
LATSNKNFKVKNGLDVSGTATAESFVKTGGTSAEFLMADGSVSAGGGGGSLEVSQTPPSSPSEGDIWYNSTSGQTFVYYDSYWVENIAGVSGPTGPQGTTGPAGVDGEEGIVSGNTPPEDTDVLWLDLSVEGIVQAGPAGADGADGADALWNFTGAWVNGVDYDPGDVVEFSGSSYYAPTGIFSSYSPPNNGWQLVASKGDIGEAGADGAQGPQGPAGPEGPEGPEGPAGASFTLTVNDIARLQGWDDNTIEPRPRVLATGNISSASGTILITWFTPVVGLTVSQVAMGSNTTAASGVTLARIGLYQTTDDGSSATLLARTANDPTLFTSATTLYTRNFDTTGGYPSSVTLTAGTRYGIAHITTGTTIGTRSGYSAITAAPGSAVPAMGSSIASQEDLPASLSSLARANAGFWGRLS